MEHPHSLLMLVLKQHYHHCPNIINSAQEVIDKYATTNVPNYEKTLGTLYQMMNDLPPDILLYYLTTVPLPKDEDTSNSTSVLPGLMKQMLCTPYHNSMRPILLKYLNDKVPPLVLITTASVNSSTIVETEVDERMNEMSTISTNNLDLSLPEKENVKSVIDENIQLDKNKGKKGGKVKNKNVFVKSSRVKPLAMLCATNIYNRHNYFCSKYNKQKKDAWRLVNSNNCNKMQLLRCYEVIRDINKKIKWLSIFKSGNVPTEVIRDEYGNSEIFYLERHLQNSVSEDILNLDSNVLNSINVFLKKC